MLFAQQQKDKAFAELNHAIELDPNRVESYLSMAKFYSSTGNRKKQKSSTSEQFSKPNSPVATPNTASSYPKPIVPLKLKQSCAKQLKLDQRIALRASCWRVITSSTGSLIKRKNPTKNWLRSNLINPRARPCSPTSIPPSIARTTPSGFTRTSFEVS